MQQLELLFEEAEAKIETIVRREERKGTMSSTEKMMMETVQGILQTASSIHRTNTDHRIEDYGEKIAGARKDWLADYAKKMENVNMESLVALPFSKVFRKPDLKNLVDTGALRDCDARYIEAVCQLYFQQAKPRPKKHNKGSDVKRWAEYVYQGVSCLRNFLTADESQRDGILAEIQADRTPYERQEQEYRHKYQEWNKGIAIGNLYSPDPLHVMYSLLDRVGYVPGEKISLPVTVVAERDGMNYKFVKLDDSKVWVATESYYQNGSLGMDVLPRDRSARSTLQNAMDWAVQVTKMQRGDNDVRYPLSFFGCRVADYRKEPTGKYKVTYLLTRYSARVGEKLFDTKEQAETFAEPYGRSAIVSEEMLYVPDSYSIYFKNPLNDESFDLEDRFSTKEAALDDLHARFDHYNAQINRKYATSSTGAERSHEADETESKYLEIRSYFDSKDHKIRYGIVVKGKYNPSKSTYNTVPYSFVEDLPTRQEAVQQMRSHREEWENKVKEWERKRRDFVYYLDKNPERKGTDYRQGKNVNEADLTQTFGFRGIQFGNWTNQSDRQAAINNAYDSFMDLARLLDITPAAIGLAGELGIAFGSRGSGDANAHYEPEQIVINLTKTRGAGSLAHEWWHALDNYFARQGNIPLGMVTTQKIDKMREALRKKVVELTAQIERSDYAKRSKQRGVYWGSMEEMTARLFENWVAEEMRKREERNPFLALEMVDAENRYAEMNYDFYRFFNAVVGKESMPFENFRETPDALFGYVYPTQKELKEFGATLRGVFDTVQEKIDENGKTILFREEPDIDIKTVNRQFNAELDRQIAGTLPKGHVYRLGMPSEALLEAGLPNLPIELSAERLAKKSSTEYVNQHPFKLENITNLPEALAHPIAVFEARRKNGAKVILTELTEKEHHFIVAIQVRQSDDKASKIEINSIRSLYPKDRIQGVFEWINRGLMTWVDKEKALKFLSTQWPNYIAGGNESESFSLSAKIVRNFQNPILSDGKEKSLVPSLRSYSYQQEMAQQDISSALNVTESVEKKFEQLAAPLATKEQVRSIVNQLEKMGLPGAVTMVNSTKELVSETHRQMYEARKQAGMNVNGRFNAELEQLTEENADNVILDCGTPNPVLLSAGMPDRKIVLYGNKLIKKAKKHNYSLTDVKNLPDALQTPIAIFKGSYEGGFALLSELEISGKKTLVTIDVNKGEIQDLNLVTSVFGKNGLGVVKWIEERRTIYADKEKTLTYLSSSAPIADATNKPRFNSTTKVIESFENPKITDENRYQLTWHGSPHDFKRFDHSFMGTGEGAQAYGWGTYVTEVEGIGRTYAESMKDKALTDKHRENRIINSLARQQLASNNGDKVAALEYLRSLLNESWSDKKRVKGQIKVIESGKFLPEGKVSANLYTVEIPDDNGNNYIEWTEPVNEETAKRIETAARREFGDDMAELIMRPIEKGNDFRRVYSIMADKSRLGSDKSASEFLQKAGFTGIKYPAQATTGGRADGARNYVIFKESDMQIADHIRYAQDGSGEIAGATLPNGDVVLNRQAMRIDTPFHEFAHKLFTYAKSNAQTSKLYDTIRSYASNAPQAIKGYVSRRYGNLSEDAFLDEVFAWALSAQSRDSLEIFLKQRGIGMEDSTARLWYERTWNAVKSLWNRIRSLAERFIGQGYADLSVFEAYGKMSTEEQGKALYGLMLGGKVLSDATFEVNAHFNAELDRQIAGTLPKGHVYRLGMPSRILQSAGLPKLPIEMAASRLLHKSNQENHPFELSEIENLVSAIQNPLAVFRSATHIGSNVILTELQQGSRNFVVAIQTNKSKGRIQINDIRGIHPRTTNIISWIVDGLMNYGDNERLSDWITEKIKSRSFLNSSTPAKVKKHLDFAAKIVRNFQNPTLSQGEIRATIENLSDTLHTPVRILRTEDIRHTNTDMERRMRGAKGWYDINQDEVVIVLDNIRDVEDAKKTVLHEVVGHKGLRQVVGEKAFTTMCESVYRSMPKNLQNEYLQRYRTTAVAGEEYMATVAEAGAPASVWSSITSSLKVALNGLGIHVHYTNKEVRALLQRSLRYMERSYAGQWKQVPVKVSGVVLDKGIRRQLVQGRPVSVSIPEKGVSQPVILSWTPEKGVSVNRVLYGGVRKTCRKIKTTAKTGSHHFKF